MLPQGWPFMRLQLRPSVLNPELWYPDRSDEAAWKRTRKWVLALARYKCRFCGHHALKHMHVHHLHLEHEKRPILVPVCVACHAVLHIGHSLSFGAVEIWKSRISQREIVRQTRNGIRKGKSLKQIKATLPITRGPLAPKSIDWANQLLLEIGNKPVISLKRPYCAVFVRLKRWQLEP